MKNILISLFFILSTCAPAHAGYIAESKINDCGRTDYSSSGVCQEQENESCHLVPDQAAGQCGILKLQDTYGGQFQNVEECDGQAACQTAWQEKECGENQAKFINQEFTNVYCINKTGKELVVDEALKAQKDQELQAKETDDANMQSAIARMECGKRVIARMIVRNAPKNLGPAQISGQNTTFAPIKGLLETGSLTTARAAIMGVTPSEANNITAEDKTALIGELDGCKPE